MLPTLLLACGHEPSPPPTAPWGAVSWRVLGDGALDVEAPEGDTLAPVVSGEGEVRAVVATLPLALGGGTPVWWRQGYQSWSWSGVVETGPLELALDVDGLPVMGGDGDALTLVAETAGTSWWAGLVGVPGGVSVHAGALAATRTKLWTATDGATLWVVWGGRGERLAVDASNPLVLDPVVLSAGDDPVALWEGWADAVGEHARPLAGPPPVGWSDWYAWYGEADEATIRADLAVAAGLDALELFQVDDGWEVAWGDWTANDRFPGGTAALAADIAAAGLRPGLWMAPFYVHRSTPTWSDHPDWFVHDADGAELGTAVCDCAVLDVTHPDAAAWLQARVAEKVAEGWTYLKLDFLYAGAQEGVRHEPVTGAEALARGYALLREAAGEDTWILACGAPMLPSVGFAESWRSGPDIAYDIAPDPDRAFLRAQARSTAARAFANGRWWWNDPDNLLARAPFDATDRTGAVAAQVASGGAWLLGDDLVTDPLYGETLAPDALATRGQTVHPVDPLAFLGGLDPTPLVERATPDDTVPSTWVLADGTTVLLNLGDPPLTVDGPGGTEVLGGTTAGPGPRTLAPGAGEVWR